MAFAKGDGARLYWRSEGSPDRPALVLLGSIGADMGLFDPVAAILAADFHLIRIDARGHGASDVSPGDYSLDLLADDVLAVMDAAGIGNAALCGLSLGGMVAITLALKAPQRVSALVLACTSPKMDQAAWVQRLALIRKDGMKAAEPVVISRFFSDDFRKRQPQQVATIQGGLLAMNPDGYCGCGAAIRDMDLRPRLSAIAAPTLVIGGTLDSSTPFDAHGRLIQDAIPGAQSRMLAAAHLACLEDPGGFAAAVKGFLSPRSAALDEASRALFENGLIYRRRILGDDWVDKALAGRTDFNADYQALITRFAWNEIWSRPGLDHRTRRLLVLAICAAQARWEEFRLHVRAGLQQGGFTRDELKETLMQTAIYAGVPAGNTAFSEAAEVMAELDKEGGQGG